MTRRPATRAKAKRKPKPVLRRCVHPFEKTYEIPPDAAKAYADTLRGLRVSPRDARKMVSVFRKTLQGIARARRKGDIFLEGVGEIQGVAAAAVSAGRVTKMRGRIAADLPVALLCQWLGCDVCRTGGYGRTDGFLIGCHPGSDGWVCLYLPVPEGFCKWSGL